MDVDSCKADKGPGKAISKFSWVCVDRMKALGKNAKGDADVVAFSPLLREATWTRRGLADWKALAPFLEITSNTRIRSNRCFILLVAFTGFVVLR